jgi:periplasmic protein TonB
MEALLISLFILASLVSLKAQNKDKESFECIIYMNQNPEFKGGEKALKAFLTKNVNYPNGAMCVNGKVYVQFIVEKDGKITNPVILKSLTKPFDDEVIKVVKLMPKWIPARDYESKKRIRSTFTMPINFELE